MPYLLAQAVAQVADPHMVGDAVVAFLFAAVKFLDHRKGKHRDERAVLQWRKVEAAIHSVTTATAQALDRHEDLDDRRFRDVLDDSKDTRDEVIRLSAKLGDSDTGIVADIKSIRLSLDRRTR